MWQGRGSPFIVSGAESNSCGTLPIMDISINGKWVAICGYGIPRYDNNIPICGSVG
jgi:hypothetical protein